ncbi:T9SS type A sorting domain-containing protein [Parasediminibacterium sp. JCM 36343]|uniref:T9SS type A sorting domain-containing protein n=1 Tax=Parasediminibacterium sp. JCM 36343 TaxID=3374279 RepID=UPI00397C4412
MKKACRFAGMLLFATLMVVSGNATIYYNTSGANLGVVGSWSTNTNGVGGTNPGNFTTAGDVFNIYNGSTATITSTWAAGSAGNAITINVGDGTNAMNFTIPSGFAVTTATGTVINVSASGTLTESNTSAPNIGTCSTGSTVIFNTSGTTFANPSGGSFYNLTINLTGASAGTFTYTNNIIANNNLIINNATTAAVALTLTGSSTSYNVTANNLTVSGSSSGATIITTSQATGGYVDVSGQLAITGTSNLQMGSSNTRISLRLTQMFTTTNTNSTSGGRLNWSVSAGNASLCFNNTTTVDLPSLISGSTYHPMTDLFVGASNANPINPIPCGLMLMGTAPVVLHASFGIPYNVASAAVNTTLAKLILANSSASLDCNGFNFSVFGSITGTTNALNTLALGTSGSTSTTSAAGNVLSTGGGKIIVATCYTNTQAASTIATGISISNLDIQSNYTSPGTIVGGTGTLTITGALTSTNPVGPSSGSLTVTSLSLGSTTNTLTLNGSDIGSSISLVNTGSSTLSFGGTTAGTLNIPSSVTSLAGLTINNTNATPATVNINSGITTAALTLTSGKLSLGSNNLTVSGAIPIGSSSSYVVATGTGSLIKSFASGVNVQSTTFNFPLGDATNFTPLVLNSMGNVSTSSATSLTVGLGTVKYTNNTSVNNYLKRYYSVLPASGFPGTTASVSMSYVRNTYGGGDVAGTETSISASQGVAGSSTFTKITALTGTSPIVFTSTALAATTTSIFTGVETVASSTGAPTVTTTAISSIAASSASSGATITTNGGASISARGVLYSSSNTTPTVGGSGVTNITDGGSSTPYTASLTGLSANTTYYVVAYATNSVGTSYGSILTFSIQTPVVTTTSATSTTINTANGLGGNLVSGSGITARGFLYSSTNTNPTLGGSGVTTITDGSTSTGSYTASPTGLTPATLYYGVAYATNGIGTAYGSVVTFSTLTISATDSTALVAFYSSLGGSSWTNKTNWLTTARVNTWYGISTSASTGQITGISLGNNNLSGSIAALQTLASANSSTTLIGLTSLNLSNNSLTGAATSNGTNGSSLMNFNTTGYNNQQCTNATTTNNSNSISFSSTTNTLPLTVGWLVTGTGIPTGTYITAIAITGSGPYTYTITLSANATATSSTATLLFGLPQFAQIQTINLSHNTGLTGTPPQTMNGSGGVFYGNTITAANTSSSGSSFALIFDRCPNLTSVDYSYCGFSAQPNNGLGTQVQTYNISHNSLTGTIPTLVSNAPNTIINVKNVDYSYNTGLTGYTDFGTNLYTINFSHCSLANSSTTISSTNATSVDLSSNSLSGTFTPTSLTACTYLDISNNQFTGLANSTFTASPFGALTTLKLNNNLFNFTSLGTKVNSVPASTTYNPQSTVVTLSYTSPTLTTNAAEGSANLYTWFRDNGSGYSQITTTSVNSLNTTTYGAGSYYVVATNTSNATALSMTSSVYVIAGVSTTAASSITASAASSGGTISYGASGATAQGIVYSITSANATPQIGGSGVTQVAYGGTLGTSPFTSALSSLGSSVNYSVQAYVTNSSGTFYGGVQTFTTLAAPTLATVTTTAISSITATSAASGATIVSNGNQTISARGVLFSSTNTSPTLGGSSVTTVTDGAVTTPYTASLTGLTSGVTYYVVAYATNPSGTAYGSVINFTTLSLPTVTTNTITATTTTTATGAGGNVTSTGGDVLSARGFLYSTSNATPTVGGSGVTTIVDGATTSGSYSASPTLNAGALYYGRAYATNSIGTAYGSVVTFSTLTISATDSTALVAFYNSLGGSSWTNKTNWLTTARVNTWYGISTSSTTGKITAINLSNNNVSGSIAALQTLANAGTSTTLIGLTSLNLSSNSLTGAATSSGTNGSSLVNFNATGYNNQQCTNATTTNTSNSVSFLSTSNSLPLTVGWLVTGTGIPTGTSITAIAITGSGPYTYTITLSSSATTTSTTATLLFGLPQFAQIQTINISHNSGLTGTPPQAMNGNGSLFYGNTITAANTGSTGSTFSLIFDRCPNLTSVDYSYCGFSAQPNNGLGTQVQTYNISHNSLTGTIPTLVSNFPNTVINVKNVDYSYNGFTAYTDFGTNLYTINLSHNSLANSSTTISSTNATSVDLSSNSLSGAFTPSSLPLCTYLDISNNQFTALANSTFTASPFGSLTTLKINNNLFDFTALGTKVNTPPSSTTYIPQNTVITLSYNNPTLTVTGAGSANTYKWYRDNGDGNGSVLVYTGSTSSINLTSLGLGGGDYIVVASNSANATLLSLTSSVFTVLALPGVSTYATTGIGSTTATLNGEVTSDGGSTITARGFVYSSSNTNPVIGGSGVTNAVDPTTGAAAVDVMSKSLTSLTSGVIYYVKAYATNTSGTTYGSVLNFSTSSRAADSTALIAFYNSTGGSSWTSTVANDSVWSAVNPITRWKGLTFTTDVLGAVKLQQMKLPSNNLSGSFTAFTTLASTVTSAGTAPLTSLTTLDLSGNSLTGKTDFNLVSGATTASSTTTSASNQLSVLAAPASIVAGWSVQGTGVPANTYITDITGTAFTLSNNATASATNTLNFGLLLLNNLVSINISNCSGSGTLPAIGPNGSLTVNQNITTVNFSHNGFSKWAAFTTFIPAVNTVVSYNASYNSISGVFDAATFTFSNVVNPTSTTALRTLNLSNNQLTTVSTQNWNGITSIDFSSNALTTASNIASGTGLQYFNASNNSLTGTSPNITATMISYDVSRNSYTASGAIDYTNIVTINDSSNAMTGGTPSFNSNKITTVYLNRNQFTSISAPVTPGFLTACRTFDVSNNLIATITPASFTASPFGSLTSLKLNNNLINFTVLGTKVLAPPSGTVYTPQNTTVVLSYSNPTLSVANTVGATGFSWYKNGSLVATTSVNTLDPIYYGSGSYTATANNSNAPLLAIASNSVSVTVTGTLWTGVVSTDWQNASNWGNGLPSSTVDARIAVATRQPVITGTASTQALTLDAGATITNNGTLNVATSFINNGTISGTGTTILNGSVAQAVSGTGTIASLTLNNSNGAIVSSGSNKLNITGILTLQSGILTTNSNVVFKSNSIASSGTLAPVGASGNSGSISGTVSVERYIPKGYRSYRDIAPSVYGASNTIYNTWQENGSYANSGYGMFITGGSKDPNTTNTSNRINLGSGFDSSLSAVKTAYTYTAGVWATIPNTYISLNPYQGYRLLVRGDRSFNLYTTPIDNTPLGLLMYNATRLRASGTLITGNVTYSPAGVSNAVTSSTYTSSTYGLNNLTDSSFSLVANPYVCPVDWRLLTKDSIENYYYYLDPTLGATGAYVAGNSGSNQYIQAGQAIFIQNKKGYPKYPVIGFTEAAKAAGNQTAVFGVESKLPIVLLRAETAGAGSYHKMDVANIVFGNGYSNGYNGNEDVPKLPNSSDNLSIHELSTSKALSIDGRQVATKDDIIAIELAQVSKANYQLQIDATSYNSNSLVPFIYDGYTKTYTALSSGLNTISFAADNTVAASYANRFKIVFKPTVLAVNSIVATATLKEGAATVSWNTVGENKVAGYTVEKSTDGTAYTAIGTATAKNTATAAYSYVDNSVTGTTYYRIKATSADGSIAFSNVVTLSSYVLRLTPYTLYPNPVINSKLNVKLENVVAGKYTVSIYNSLGQKVHAEVVSHNGGTSTHGLSIAEKLANGVYNVTISSVSSKQVVYNASVTVQ